MTTREQLEALDGQIEKLTGDAASLLARLSILHSRRSALVVSEPLTPLNKAEPSRSDPGQPRATHARMPEARTMGTGDESDEDGLDLKGMSRTEAIETIVSDLEFGVSQQDLVALLKQAGRSDTPRQVTGALNHLKLSERVSRLPNGEWAVRQPDVAGSERDAEDAGVLPLGDRFVTGGPTWAQK